MRLMRRLNWTVPVLLCAIGGVASVGCKAKAELKVATPAPPPPAPPPDQDGDGILDPDDACPTEKEDGNPPSADDGCPNKDMDGDGIAIPQDQCPDKPETVNSYQDDDGCPDEKPIVVLKEKEVEINQKIMFKKNASDIEDQSLVVIDAVAKVLNANPDVQLLEVGGHASAEGPEWYNRTLTQKRVDAVVKALVKRGVPKPRLLSQGYGPYCPVATGEDEASLEKNRRVEFKILYRKGKDLQQNRGCETSLKKGIKPQKLPSLEAATKAAATDAKKAEPKKAEPKKAAAPTKAIAAPAKTKAAPADAAKAPAAGAGTPPPTGAPAGKAPAVPAPPATKPATP